MTKYEFAILAAKDPAAYIDASLRAVLPPAVKARLARQWMEKTGFSRKDILHARNRHPYWKQKKMEGSAERTRRRLIEHDYSSGLSVEWNAQRVVTFLDLNGKDKNGRYEHHDWELAQVFGASIPSIQYMRRKFRRATELLGARASRAKIVEYLTFAESVLVRGSNAVEKLRGERAREAKGLTESLRKIPGIKAASFVDRFPKAGAKPKARAKDHEME
ncbi:MAG: hypothetical protein M0001_00345 [Treponema sp.]|nr:hypothetical protein [Treponema sp.]